MGGIDMNLSYKLMQGERLVCQVDCTVPFLAIVALLVVGTLVVYFIYRWGWNSSRDKLLARTEGTYRIIIRGPDVVDFVGPCDMPSDGREYSEKMCEIQAFLKYYWGCGIDVSSTDYQDDHASTRITRKRPSRRQGQPA